MVEYPERLLNKFEKEIEQRVYHVYNYAYCGNNTWTDEALWVCVVHGKPLYKNHHYEIESV